MKKNCLLFMFAAVLAISAGCGMDNSPKSSESIVDPNAPKAVESIMDTSDEKGAVLLCYEETFYEDENYVYSFGMPISEYVIVKYTDGSEQNVVEALEEGNIEIFDLDTYGIKYWAESKHGEEKKEFVINSNAGKHTACVELKELRQDGFGAIVTDYTRFDAYNIGTELYLKFTEDSLVSIYTEAGQYACEGIPDMQKIPIGRQVYVSFYKSEEISDIHENSQEDVIAVYVHEMLSEYLF